MPVYHTRKGSFINDVTQILNLSDPLPPPLHYNDCSTCAQTETKFINPFPLLVCRHLWMFPNANANPKFLNRLKNKTRRKKIRGILMFLPLGLFKE